MEETDRTWLGIDREAEIDPTPATNPILATAQVAVIDQIGPEIDRVATDLTPAIAPTLAIGPEEGDRIGLGTDRAATDRTPAIAPTPATDREEVARIGLGIDRTGIDRATAQTGPGIDPAGPIGPVAGPTGATVQIGVLAIVRTSTSTTTG